MVSSSLPFGHLTAVTWPPYNIQSSKGPANTKLRILWAVSRRRKSSTSKSTFYFWFHFWQKTKEKLNRELWARVLWTVKVTDRNCEVLTRCDISSNGGFDSSTALYLFPSIFFPRKRFSPVVGVIFSFSDFSHDAQISQIAEQNSWCLI